MTGESISLASYNPQTTTDWIWANPADTCVTAMGAISWMNRSSIYLYYGLNLQSINASHFDVPWWFRSVFTIPSTSQQQPRMRLVFKGINYKADVYVNGVQIADEKTMIGTFRWFELDVTEALLNHPTSVIALRISRPHVDGLDLAISFVDWTSSPPDSNLGVWQPIELVVMPSPIAITSPVIWTTELRQNNTIASLRIGAVITNWATEPLNDGGILQSQIIDNEGQIVTTLQTHITEPLIHGKSMTIVFDTVHLNNPKLWWPWQMGAQNFYTALFTFIFHHTNDDSSLNTTSSTTTTRRFGIRTITDTLDSNGHRLYKVNGLPILIRGGGWSPDLFLQVNSTRQLNELQYARHLNLNTIRMEGKFEGERFYDLADEMGLLIMPGWCCCDAWQQWKHWKPIHHFIASESLRSQVQRLRSHPSVFVFLMGSDMPPTASVEKEFLSVFHSEFWPNPTLSSASSATSSTTGDPSGVKMTGPYSYVSPNYWLLDKTGALGGAYGFLTEGGPGENPATQSLMRFTPPTHLWPIDDHWNYHCGSQSGEFGTLKRFLTPLIHRYGEVRSLHDFAVCSQAMAYEGHRAMFEAYTLRRHTNATGVIQWMMNSAWPSHIWHLYDSMLTPDAAFFATRLANAAIHPIYDYSDGSVWISNSLYTPFISSGPLHLLVRAIAVPSVTVVFQQDVSVVGNQLSSDSVLDVGVSVPQFPPSSWFTMYLVRLDLYSGQDVITSNTYWLSTQPDELDWASSTWYNTPTTVYANYTALRSLGPSKLTYKAKTTKLSDTEMQTQVAVTNDAAGPVAFLVHVRVLRGATGINVTPIFWNNNFVTLLPAETYLFSATYSIADLDGTDPTIQIGSFN